MCLSYSKKSKNAFDLIGDENSVEKVSALFSNFSLYLLITFMWSLSEATYEAIYAFSNAFCFIYKLIWLYSANVSPDKSDYI